MSAAFPPEGGAATTEDELLDLGGRPRRGGRWWWLGVVLLAAGATVWVATRPAPPDRHAAARTTAPTAPATAAVRHTSPCDGIAHCEVRLVVPLALEALAHKRLAPDVGLRGSTVLVVGAPHRPGRLVFRELVAYFHSATVIVRVDHSPQVTTPLAPDPPGVGSILLHRANAGFQVRLQYLAPETVPPRLADLVAFMQDPLLTTV